MLYVLKSSFLFPEGLLKTFMKVIFSSVVFSRNDQHIVGSSTTTAKSCTYDLLINNIGINNHNKYKEFGTTGNVRTFFSGAFYISCFSNG